MGTLLPGGALVLIVSVVMAMTGRGGKDCFGEADGPRALYEYESFSRRIRTPITAIRMAVGDSLC